MAKEFDYLEKEALRYGAGVPADTKWRNLSPEQRQGFDNYVKAKVRRDPSVYEGDARAKKYLKDYDSSTFDQMRQQEIKDSVNPGGIWDDFGGAAEAPVQSDFNYSEGDYGPDRSDETRAREEEREDLRNEDDKEPEEKPDDTESPKDNPEDSPGKPDSGGAGAGKTVKGLGEAGGAEGEAIAAKGAGALATAGESVPAASAVEAAVAADAGLSALPILAVVAGLVAFFLILSLLVAVSWGSPDMADALGTGSNSGAAAMVDGNIPVPYYSQTAPAPWHNDSYGGCGTIGSSGCGITSLAMVITYWTGKDVLPSETAKVAASHGWRVCGSGTAYAAMTGMPKLYGLKGKELGGGSSGWAKDKEYLDKGIPVIQLHHAPSIFTSGGHYIVITGYSGSTVYVNDPVYSHKKFQKGVDVSEMLKSMDNSWAVYK